MARISGKKDGEQQLKRLGDAIRAKRKAAGLTQEALADAADIDRAHMGKIERGERNVTVLNLIRIAVAIGCGASDLMSAADL